MFYVSASDLTGRNFPERVAREIQDSKKYDWSREKPETKELIQMIKRGIKFFVDGKYNLFIYSSRTGNGKTLIASYLGAVCCKMYHEVHNAYFVSVPELLYVSRRAFSDEEANKRFSELEANIRAARLVIWDDVGVKAASAYDNEVLYVLFNSHEGANIITSNYSPNKLLEFMDSRIVDRLTDGDCVEFLGGGHRGAKSKRFSSSEAEEK